MKINDHVTWVGINDSSSKQFHGDAYRTPHGTSYNAYLIEDEKNALIDTVYSKHSHDFIEKLQNTMDIKSIDYLIIQHGEIDHTGGLMDLLEIIPDVIIYCTEECMYTIKGHYHRDFHFVLVKTGDILNLGKRKLMFFEMKMLHWPDNMMTYLLEDQLLFSSDVYSQHLDKSGHMTQQDKIDEAMKFYANIFTPFSRLYQAKIKQIKGYDLSIKTICPSHGFIWDNRDILNYYDLWSQDYQENQITILYDSYWGGTETLAKNISEGILVEDHTTIVKCFKISTCEANDLILEIFKSKAILIGSPTINNGYTSSIAALLNDIKGMRYHKKKASAFGCHGWSGEAVLQIRDFLKESGFDCLDKSLNCLWQPDESNAYEAHLFGKYIARHS